uniref:J domain-containing protein n=1 Tax=Otus sunia TaxID=257818 RepID=A0A8C8AXB2_9STRI
MVDYYEVLGLQKSASQDDVRKSYYKLALKWHPDKNLSNKEEAEKKFKAVAEAYQVLSDPQKRLCYSRSVKESRSHRESATEGYDSCFDCSYVLQDLKDIFREIFGRMEPFVHCFWNPLDNIRNNYKNWKKMSFLRLQKKMGAFLRMPCKL